jgi:hypothetical protein
MTARDAITVLRARGRRLAKLICADGKVVGYDAARTFDLFEVPVVDLAAVRQLVLRLMQRPDCCIVRGVPVDPARSKGVRRLAYLDRETGDQPTLRDAAHRWLALDVEGVPRPASVPVADLSGCAGAAIRRLPAAFSAARCIVQASASHGLKPDIRLRLWYWLDRATSAAELTQWLRHAPADPAVFRAVQPIYTAAPVFAPGLQDHLAQRLAELPGKAMVAAPHAGVLTPPRHSPAAPLPKPNAACARGYALAVLSNAAARIRQTGEGQRHATILKEARSLARLVGAGLLTDSDMSNVLRGAGRDIGKPEDEIDSIVAWAMAHPSTMALRGGDAG